MPFLLRLCIGLVVLVPTLVHAQGVLESPGDGANLSGIGFISGWKCNAGTLTVTLDDGPPIPVAAGQPRADTRAVCGTTNNGFITQMNWAFLDEGVHIAKAYDNGVVFATNIFEVATLGEEFVKGAAGECRVPDFPGPGESTLFGWNESTQHLEIIHLEIIYEGSSPADHGDTANEATQVLVPSSTSGKFEDPEDRDWFAIRVIEAGVLMVELRGEESILGHLFHHTTGLSILAVESREREVAVTPGDYLFIVERGFAGVGAEYELEVWMRGGGRAAADHAQGVLESPSDGANLSGIGFISGWKCNAGTLTITLDDGPPIPVAAGQPRADTRAVCGTANNGFITQMNWAFLDEGVHIARAYDNEVVFATNIFEVATLGEEFVKGAAGECRVPDFPGPGESTLFGWNESTQHLEVVREESGVTPHPSDAPENLPQVATVVGLNSSTSGTLEAQGDVNYFRIEILQDGVVIVETTGSTNTKGGLLGADGRWLATDDDSSPSGRNFRIRRTVGAGTYYIRVFGSQGTTTGPYTLIVRFQASGSASERLVQVRPVIKLPAGVSIPNVNVISLYSSAAEVPASGGPSLMLAEDAGGTVLLALTTAEGGMLGETRGAVDVSVESTVITLVGLAAGISVHDMTPRVVDAIVQHAQYRAVVSAFRTRFVADKNVLDRIYDHPALVRLIREVAEDIVRANTLATTIETDMPPDTWTASSRMLALATQDPNCASKQNIIRQEGMLDLIDTFVPVTTAKKAVEAVRSFATIPQIYRDCDADRARQWEAQHGSPPSTPPFEESPDTDDLLESFAADVRRPFYNVETVLVCGAKLPGPVGRVAKDAVVKVGKLIFESVGGWGKVAVRATRKAWVKLAVEGWKNKKQVAAAARIINAADRAGCSFPPPSRGEGSEDDHGNTSSAATQVGVPSRTAGHLEHVADQDYFQFHVPQAGTVTVMTTGGTDTFGTLYSGATGVVAGDDNSGEGSNFWIERAVAVGTYFIRVASPPPGEAGAYTLHVRHYADDHGNTDSDATRVGVPSQTAGRLEHVLDQDYFRFQVPEAGTVTVETTGGTDTLGYLYSGATGAVARDDNSGAGNNFKIVHSVGAGTYFIRVVSDQQRQAGAYTLHVRLSADDHGNTSSEATQVGVPSQTAGRLEHVADEDYFRFQVPEAGTVTVETTGGTDTLGYLYSGARGEVAQDNNSGAGNNFKIVHSVGAGTYFIRVVSDQQRQAGAYALRVSFQASEPDEGGDDHGDTPQTATPVGLPSSTEGKFERTGDVDYFRVTVAEPGQLTISTLALFVHTNGELSDSGGRVLATATGANQLLEGSFSIRQEVEPGTYYVKVTGYAEASAGFYLLDTHFTRSATPPPPPGGAVCGRPPEEFVSCIYEAYHVDYYYKQVVCGTYHRRLRAKQCTQETADQVSPISLGPNEFDPDPLDTATYAIVNTCEPDDAYQGEGGEIEGDCCAGRPRLWERAVRDQDPARTPEEVEEAQTYICYE